MMKLSISKDANVNYLAKIVKVDSFKPHPNANKLKLATVDGYIIAISSDYKEGIYIYFPTECTIDPEFLSFNNLYRKSEKNADKNKQGFFEDAGRVRCIKLRGIGSEGFIMPINTLESFVGDIEDWESLVGTEFDSINNKKFVWKYILKPNGNNSSNGKQPPAKEVLNIVNNQYRQHVDTVQLQKAMYDVNPDDIISISWKEHGTSLICCNLMTYRTLSLRDKIAKWFGAHIQETEYKNFASSRRVIKDPNLNPSVSKGYYNYDIWSIANEVIKPFVHPGMTIYAEIVGFMPDGSYIQKDYDYKCVYHPKLYDYSKMNPQQMYDAKLFNIIVYRITSTDIQGRVHEWSVRQMIDYCDKYGINHIKELYYGKAKDLFDLSTEQHWHENFIESLRETYLERDSILCNNKVPEEGIVLRREVSDISVYKLKSVNFLERESKALDKETIDIESTQE